MLDTTIPWAQLLTLGTRAVLAYERHVAVLEKREARLSFGVTVAKPATDGSELD